MKGKGKKKRLKRQRPWFEEGHRRTEDEEKGHRARDRERRELEEALEEALRRIHEA